jgi:hypothetical protein
MAMQWTPEAKAAARDAQADRSAEVLDAAIQRAEALAAEAGSGVVDTDLWTQALAHARFVEAASDADDEQEEQGEAHDGDPLA